MSSGTRAASACSAARVTFSPTTAPIEPPMNPKSMTQMATGISGDGAGAPQRRVAHAGRCLGGGQPVDVGLAVDEAERVHRLEAGVVLDPALVVDQLLEPVEADSRKWWPQVGHTRIALSSCLLNSIDSHDGHFVQRSGG